MPIWDVCAARNDLICHATALVPTPACALPKLLPRLYQFGSEDLKGKAQHPKFAFYRAFACHAVSCNFRTQNFASRIWNSSIQQPLDAPPEVLAMLRPHAREMKKPVISLEASDPD